MMGFEWSEPFEKIPKWVDFLLAFLVGFALAYLIFVP